MVEVRQTIDEWLIEVRGEVIGRAETSCEAEALAGFWRARIECVARWRMDPQQTGLPFALLA